MLAPTWLIERWMKAKAMASIYSIVRSSHLINKLQTSCDTDPGDKKKHSAVSALIL